MRSCWSQLWFFFCFLFFFFVCFLVKDICKSDCNNVTKKTITGWLRCNGELMKQILWGHLFKPVWRVDKWQWSVWVCDRAGMCAWWAAGRVTPVTRVTPRWPATTMHPIYGITALNRTQPASPHSPAPQLPTMNHHASNTTLSCPGLILCYVLWTDPSNQKEQNCS